MKKAIYSFVFIFVLSFFPNNVFSQPEVTPALADLLSEKAEDDFFSLNIRLEAQYDQNLLFLESRKKPNREIRREFVMNELREFSQKNQAGLLAFLEDKKKKGMVKDITPYWIANVVNAKVKPEVVNKLMARKDLARLDYNQERMVLMSSPEPDLNPVAETDKTTSPNLAWNITRINADQAWGEGYTGEDIVVAVLDTGVNYNHLDLQDNMWTHPDYPNHGYNFVNNNDNTMDYSGHGTHCAGTVAGNGAAGTATGIAPDAKIMALAVLSSTGSGTEAGVWSAIQFAVDNGAHIMSLSLGWKHAWNPDRTTWRTTMNNALSAGLVAAVAAGNEGNSWSDTPPSEVRTPGDVPPPWLHPDQTLTGGTSAVVSVGSTTSTDNLSGFSSKGPVTWQNVAPFSDYEYNPEMGLIRPDVVAPGSNILSLTHNHNSGYTTMSGTSMATPAVAGVMALMLSKNPELTPEEITQVLEESALELSTNKSNQYGSGRVDALEAVMQTSFGGVAYTGHELDDSQGNNDGKINPGEFIKMHVTFENPSEDPYENVQAALTTTSPYITLVDSMAALGTFQPGDTLAFEEIFSFEVSDIIPGNHEINFTLSTFEENEPGEDWRSNFSETAYAPALEIAGYQILDGKQGNNNGRLEPGETATLRFKIENHGQLNSDLLNLLLEAIHPFILIENPHMQHDAIEAGGSIHADYTVTAHENINPGTTAGFSKQLTAGAYELELSFEEKIGAIVEDWESGDFEQFDWSFSGDEDWIIDEDESYQGTYSVRSGTISHNQNSELLVVYEVSSQDSISFYRKVSSENNYDWLEFYIDEERVGRWSGEKSWERVVFPVEEGLRTFRWVYEKDASVSQGEDAGWIDEIELPAKTVTSAFAGFDAEECNNTPFFANGYATMYDNLQWATSGDGSFENPEEMTTYYFPGPEDINSGSVNLSLEASFEEEEPVSHEMELSFLPTPEVDLGGDAMVCLGETLELDAGQGNFYYSWFDGSENQFYLIDPENFEENEIVIWVEVFHQENGCADTDTIHVVFEDCTYVSEINPERFLEVYPNPARERVTVSFFNPGAGESSISLINQSGQLVKTMSHEDARGWTTLEVELSGLNPGVYFIRIENTKGQATRKLLVQ